MNRSARVASAAEADRCQFLVTDTVKSVVRDRIQDVAFHDHGSVEAKGVGPLQVFEVVRRGEPSQRERQRADYLADVARAHQWIDLGGLAPQVGSELLRLGLDDVFVHLSARRRDAQPDRFLREEIRLRRDLDEHVAVPAERERRLRELAEWFDQRYSNPSRPAEERIGIATLTEQARNVVLGDPGAGKTTLLRYAARRVALRKALDGTDAPLTGPWAELTPVYVRVGALAANLAQAGGASFDHLIARGAGQYAVPMDSDLFDFERRASRCLFLFDGLDEIADASLRRQVRDGIREYAAGAAAGCRFVVTSRIVGYREAPLGAEEAGFAHFTLASFDDAEIARFVERWYAAVGCTGQVTDPMSQNARVLLNGIRGNPSVRRLATNPLLITLISLLYWRDGGLPRRRIELYRCAVETLIDKWRRAGLDVRESTFILMAVAFEMHAASGVGLVTQPELERLIIDLKVDPQRGGRSQLDAERETADFIRRVNEQSGMLYARGREERGFDVFGFLHLTFEEYFAARELARRWKQSTLVLEEYLHLPRWHEIVLLASAHLSDEDDESASDRFVQSILNAGSAFEDVLHRDLLLAARCLGDDAVVRPALRAEIFARLERVFSTSNYPLMERIGETLAAVAGSRAADAAIDLALTKIRHDDWGVQHAAARALGALGAQAPRPQFLAMLAGLLRDENPGTRASAADAARVMGERAAALEIPAILTALLRDKSSLVRRSAAAAVGALGERAATPQLLQDLTRLLRDRSSRVRSHAAYALRALERRAVTPELLQSLLTLLRDKRGPVRASAASILGMLGERAATPEVLTALAALLRDDVPGTRASAASALASLSERAATLTNLTSLAKLLHDHEPDVRASAAETLGEIGGWAAMPDVLTDLLALLRDEHWAVRFSAAYALGALGEHEATPEVMTALVAVLRDESSRVRASAADAFELLGEWAATPEVLTALTALLRDRSSRVRASAADALGELGDRAATPEVLTALTALLHSKSSRVRASAARAVGTLGKGTATPDVVPALTGLLRDQDSNVRSSAAHALGRFGERAAIPEVLENLHLLLADPSPHRAVVEFSAYHALMALAPARTPLAHPPSTARAKPSSGARAKSRR